MPYETFEGPCPQDLYRAAWLTTARTYFFPERLDNWARWEHRFDGCLHSVDDAVNAVAEMLASIGDNYTYLKVPENLRQDEQEQRQAPPPCFTRMLTRGLAWVRIDTFSHNRLTDCLRRCMYDVRRADGYIIDLRGNGGGFTYQANDACAAFMDGGATMTMKRRSNGEHGSFTAELELSSNGFRQFTAYEDGAQRTESWERMPNYTGRQPLVILVDDRTASAAELFAGILRDNRHAYIIGSTPTFGKGIGQDEYEMPFGCSLKITDAIILPPSGQWRGDCGVTVRNGLVPDLYVADDPHRDPVMSAAMHFLSRKLGAQVLAPLPERRGNAAGWLAAAAFGAAAFLLAV